MHYSVTKKREFQGRERIIPTHNLKEINTYNLAKLLPCRKTDKCPNNSFMTVKLLICCCSLACVF